MIGFTVSGLDGRIVAHPLDAPASALPKLTAEQKTNRKRLADVITKLVSASRWNVRSTAAFRPTQYSAWGVKLAVAPTHGNASPFDVSSFGTDTPTCISVHQAAESMPPTAGPSLSWGASTYNVVMRPVLPGEKVCVALFT